MQKVVLALFLVAVTIVSARTLEKRQSEGEGGATGTGSGGVAGVGAGVNGANKQTCQAMQATCASAACSSSNTQINSASGSGTLLGLGQLLGNVGAPVNVRPPICATCTQLGLGTIG